MRRIAKKTDRPQELAELSQKVEKGAVVAVAVCRKLLADLQISNREQPRRLAYMYLRQVVNASVYVVRPIDNVNVGAWDKSRR